MSRTIAAATLANYRSGTSTMVPCLVIIRTDEQVFRFIGHDRDLPIDGDLFEAAPGLDISSLVSTEGFVPDNAELKVLDSEDAIITRADLLAGIWDGAQMQIGLVAWDAVTPVIDVLKVGSLGIAKAKRGYFTLEFRDLRQAAQGSHDTVLQPTCRYRVGVRNATSHCPVNIEDDYTETGTLTGVTSQYVVTDSAFAMPDDWAGEGYFTFTSGLNAGLVQKVKTQVGGTFTFWAQFIFPITGDETYSVTAGCRLRPYEDCRDKFDVMADFGGEYNARNPDSLTAPAV